MQAAFLLRGFPVIESSVEGEEDAQQHALLAWWTDSSANEKRRGPPFSRDAEFEEGRIDSVIMARAGFDPSGFVLFFNVLESVGKDYGITEEEMIHPSHSRRIAELEEHLPTNLKSVCRHSKASGRRSGKGGGRGGSAPSLLKNEWVNEKP
ncbi:unnamed protein product [Phaeothamnion confervicola]